MEPGTEADILHRTEQKLIYNTEQNRGFLDVVSST